MSQILTTTDALVIINNEEVVLIGRAKEPFMDKLVMPGGHVDLDDKSVVYACARELEEEVGLKVDPEDLKFLMILDVIGRDPRPDARRISIVYQINLLDEKILSGLQAATDAKEIFIKNIEELKPEDMGFDHWLAIKRWKETNN